SEGLLPEPTVHWQGWDVVLARSGRSHGGTLINLPAAAPKLRWRGVNCLYTGWEYLVKGAKNIEAPERSAWEKFCTGDSVDRGEAERWPAAPSPEPAEVPAGEYRTNVAPGAPVGYASTSWPCLAVPSGSPLTLPSSPKGEGEKGADPNASPTIGCPVSRLPATRHNWLQ